ncbi:hypothetical protein F4V57_10825 [Acinetobacter qingfengensis]|uniref:Uncharacterized protein n=1 Tax=Acinetobacter qingfengensis TaxID=1262585 RepID=A0A1E7RDD7_9GAMM|nr:hypothetical protein [Acinetobacter qingfengensis]KAA8732106.1 hypothetical protein F4V57_10825 [Acinetobacter qingfengensis]OEY97185.1 hypothetical protein BJI46_01805 [Acinetobacter qingfengensis]
MCLEQRLIEFAESGNQQKIILADGQIIQGWIMEINEQALLISSGYNDKSGKDHWISLPLLQQSQLQYWDNQLSSWQDFVL